MAGERWEETWEQRAAVTGKQPVNPHRYQRWSTFRGSVANITFRAAMPTFTCTCAFCRDLCPRRFPISLDFISKARCTPRVSSVSGSGGIPQSGAHVRGREAVDTKCLQTQRMPWGPEVNVRIQTSEESEK